jgi:HAD superfamily hydrolase (TIGR01509 family)
MKDPRSYSSVVFDMGHVLSEYSSRKAIEQFTYSREIADEVRIIVYCSYEWALLDCGLMDEDTVLHYTLHRLKSDEARDVARKSIACWDKYNLWPKPGMDEVVRAVKGRGQKVYVLSNAGSRLKDCWRRVLPCPDLYDGLVFSALEKCIKPQKEIYHVLFDRYGLNPADCLFIDDLPWNIRGGEDCGMDGWCFASGDVEELKKFLRLK